MSKKKLLIFSLATVLVVALVGVGVVVAKKNASLTDITQQPVPSEPATYEGIDQIEQSDATNNTINQAGDEIVKKGSVPTVQAQQSNNQAKQPNKGDKPGGGPPMMFRPDDIAQILGITAEELQAELKAGKTLEQIAGNKGMTLAQLKEKLIAKTKTELDNQVSQGKLTAEQAQSMLTRLKSIDLSKLGAGPEMRGDGPPQQTPPSSRN